VQLPRCYKWYPGKWLLLLLLLLYVGHALSIYCIIYEYTWGFYQLCTHVFALHSKCIIYVSSLYLSLIYVSILFDLVNCSSVQLLNRLVNSGSVISQWFGLVLWIFWTALAPRHDRQCCGFDRSQALNSKAMKVFI
jgi:hypothetical protein